METHRLKDAKRTFVWCGFELKASEIPECESVDRTLSVEPTRPGQTDIDKGRFSDQSNLWSSQHKRKKLEKVTLLTWWLVLQSSSSSANTTSGKTTTPLMWCQQFFFSSAVSRDSLGLICWISLMIFLMYTRTRLIVSSLNLIRR